MKNIRPILALFGVVILMAVSSCSKNKSYAELLSEERHAVNAYLANQKIVNEIPDDNNFLTGKDAPFYRIDPDGNVYMQVIRATDIDEDEAKVNEPIYFRYMRYDLLSWYNNGTWEGEGNASEMSLSSTYFLFSNFTAAASAQYGYGIQLPLTLIGVNSEVNLIIRSQYGNTSEISYVRPFLYNVRYFRSKI